MSEQEKYFTGKGCVYFFKQSGVDGIKIGFSTHPEPSSRFKQFKTYCSGKALLLGFITCSNPKELESKLHDNYSHKRMNGEWFNITSDDVARIIRQESEQDFLDQVDDFYRAYCEFIYKIMNKEDLIQEQLAVKKNRNDSDYEKFLRMYHANPELKTKDAARILNKSERTIQRWKKQLEEEQTKP